MEESFERKFEVDPEGTAEAVEPMQTDLENDQRWRMEERNRRESEAQRRRDGFDQLSPEERAQRDAVEAGKDRHYAAAWFRERVRQSPSGQYSEKLAIDPDGTLNRDHRYDDKLPSYIVSVGDLGGIEDLYNFSQVVRQENPDLEFSFDSDPEGKWVRYTVSELKER